MRGNTAAPLMRSGAEDSTLGVPGGIAPGAGGVGVTPGGSLGGSTKGESGADEPSAGVGAAEASTEWGHGSVRNDPRASARIPFRHRARTR